jgi:predicted metal-binding protein
VTRMSDGRLSELLAFAGSLGIADAKVLGVDRITVEDRFRSYCVEPRCPNYNTSINCPPHSMTPDEFREHIKGFSLVLAFKFDMPMEAVQETELREAALLLHETTAAIEHQAQSLGFELARGYSSGACKKTLCYEHADCAALQEGGRLRCRHSGKARPSLSGMGVNWHELSKTLGWVMHKTEEGDLNSKAETIMMAGLVFLE